jgi:hypothetical protein
MQKHVAFLKPTHARKKIDRIDYHLSRDEKLTCFTSDTMRIYVVGLEKRETIPIGDDAFVIAGQTDFFSPVFIETKTKTLRPQPKELASDKCVIEPKALLSRGDLKLSLGVKPSYTSAKVAGLCRFDDKKNGWRWIETSRSADSIFGSTSTGGTFALAVDIEPPVIEQVSIKHLSTIALKRPRITMKITDNLAGFTDDTNFLIKLDGEWMIPDYDAETGIMTIIPKSGLKDGEHHLSIEVTDRLGHKGEKYLRFNIAASAKQGRKR